MNFPKDFPDFKFTRDIKEMVGKTILSIDTSTLNCWEVKFTDGSNIFLWAEIGTHMGMPQLWVSKKQ